jgi:hypothetical protein
VFDPSIVSGDRKEQKRKEKKRKEKKRKRKEKKRKEKKRKETTPFLAVSSHSRQDLQKSRFLTTKLNLSASSFR